GAAARGAQPHLAAPARRGALAAAGLGRGRVAGGPAGDRSRSPGARPVPLLRHAPGVGGRGRGGGAAAGRGPISLRAPSADELHAAVSVGPAGDVPHPGPAERRADRVRPARHSAGGARPAPAVRGGLRGAPPPGPGPAPVAASGAPPGRALSAWPWLAW